MLFPTWLKREKDIDMSKVILISLFMVLLFGLNITAFGASSNSNNPGVAVLLVDTD